MRITSLTGTQNIDGGENNFSMVVEAAGEAYNIPISFDTYQLLNELAVVAREQAVPHQEVEQPVFSPPVSEPPALEWEEQPEQPDHSPALDQLAKIGLFEPSNVLDAVQAADDPDVDELMGVLEDTSDEDEEDDPGEMSIDDSVGQYPGD